ncbi:hypothetical protein [Foetidibacter luteolus]|uniref:hypothetical protein n=1 Tax=Foetidibacter luteolus TaxID=2608880 RepID=UPI00129A956E|nr:hypothetical protein [Foetidibacter luteolus]
MANLKYFLLALAIYGLAACRKNVDNQLPDSVEEATSTEAGTENARTGRLSYGKSLFYLKNQAGNYTVLPVSKPAAAGYFKANPLGLRLDSATGRINVTLSETGLRYKIYYISPTGKLLDSVKIVISGIDYRDAIYEIKKTPVAYDTAFPIYNANTTLALPCGSGDDDDDDDDDNGCVFDETDLNNDGNDDIPGVIQDKLLVDEKRGTIDVEASFHAGIFGSSNPANDLRKDFTFYYRLNDASNMALNKITVRVYHYKKRSDIPASLLAELNNRRLLAAAVNSRGQEEADLSGDYIYGDGMDAFSAFRFQSKMKRPPIIIIVSQYTK